MIVPKDIKGFLFYENTWIRVGDTKALEVYIPGEMTIRAHKRLVIFDVAGLSETVKQDLGFKGYEISISGRMGKYVVLQRPDFSGVPLGGVLEAVSSPIMQFIPYKITDLMTSLRRLQNLLRTKGMKYPVCDAHGILAALEITHVVVQQVEIRCAGQPEVRYTVSLLSELPPERELDLFPTEAGNVPRV